MNWSEPVKKVTPYIVKIETPQLSGTGFLYFYNEDHTVCAIATAGHVLEAAEEWQQPIRIKNHTLEESVFLKESERVIYVQKSRDSAVILFPTGGLKLPEETIPLFPTDKVLGIGSEVGWIGFPAIRANIPCFFSGTISASEVVRKAYLIDGVAINGVSGGPVIHRTDADGVQIVGTISAYMANRATGETLPGLSVAQDVSHFHAIIKHIKSLDEARKHKAQLATEPPATALPLPLEEEPVEPAEPAHPEDEPRLAAVPAES